MLDAIDRSSGEFVEICDQFTNKRRFVIDRHGQLVKDRGNLTKINDDDVG